VPFHPARKELQVADKLVWLDGQGLGHTAESASSVSTKTSKYPPAEPGALGIGPLEAAVRVADAALHSLAT
jgi:hypothetical protein